MFGESKPDMLFKLFESFQSSQRITLYFESALIAGTMACFGVSYLQFVQRIFPGWLGGYLPWLFALIALEVTYTSFANRDKSFGDQLNRHLTEWLVVFFLIKLLTMLFNPQGSILHEVSLWEKDILNFFSLRFLAALLPAVIVWVASFSFAGDLSNMQVDESDLQIEDQAMLDKNKIDYRRRLSERILMLGVGVILLALFARVDLIRVFGESSAARAPVYNVVVYFLLGFLLLSQAQFTSLNRSWLWDRVPTSMRLPRRWLDYSMIFFVLLALVALLLPTHYTIGLLATLRIVVNFLAQLVSLLLFLITYPFILLLNLLFRHESGENPAPPTLDLPRLSESPAAPGPPLPWLEILRSLVFWLVFGAIVVYFFRSYLLQNRQLLDALHRVKLFHWLSQAWSSLRGWLRGVNSQVVQAVKAGRDRLFSQRRASLPAALRRSIHFKGLSPRRRIIFFYLRLVERGGEQGIPRAPSQTPSQYSQQLRQALPEVEPELDGLTEAFLDARYSPHDVDPGDASAVQRLWKRILQALHAFTP